MLTRIEIDGFKSFENFSVDLNPFTAVVGPNGSGKSNLFDAIRLLSRLANEPIAGALQEVRGDVRDLFRRHDPNSKSQSIRLAAEVLVSPVVRDAWGEEVTLDHTRIRYELRIVYVMEQHERFDRYTLAHEKACPILPEQDASRLGETFVSEVFRSSFLKYKKEQPWIKTDQGDGRLDYRISEAEKVDRSGSVVEKEIKATLLSSVTSAKEYPHLVALREELRSWKMIHLDPDALRAPCSTAAPPILEPDGTNLPRLLWEINDRTGSDHQMSRMLADLSADLSTMVPGVLQLGVEKLEKEGKFLLTVRTRDGVEFPSSVVSEGTLRVIALLTALSDPWHRGLLCIEEPENGIHPARLNTLVDIIRDSVTDFHSQDASDVDSLCQVLVNTHSPAVLSALDASEILFAEMVGIADPKSPSPGRATRMRPVWPKQNGELPPDKKASFASQYDISRYLKTVPGEV